jgi:hypothetical protein
VREEFVVGNICRQIEARAFFKIKIIEIREIAGYF